MRQETNINLLNKEKGSSFIDNIIDNDLSTGSLKMEWIIKNFEQWLTWNTSNPMVSLSGNNDQLEKYYRRENVKNCSSLIHKKLF